MVVDELRQTDTDPSGTKLPMEGPSDTSWQAVDVCKTERCAAKGQRPAVVWFTGLSGAGKSTIANVVERTLHDQGRHTYLLDGDNVRNGLNRHCSRW
jgi:adenylylsulfate kinase-like enzyme